jgi:hypothetical protein
MSVSLQSATSPAAASPRFEGAAFDGMNEDNRARAHAALGEMLGGIERIRTAMRAVMSTAKVAIKPADSTQEWGDLMFILQNTVARMERGWRELNGHPAPNKTKAYATAKAIGWDLEQHINALPKSELDRIAALMAVRGAWPQEIIFEPSLRGKHATYKETLDKDASAARGKEMFVIGAIYKARTPTPGASDFVYPGFSAHFEWRKESLYYQTQINFGMILDILRKKIEDGQIAPRMGAVYVAHLIYCYYEMVLATRSYASALNMYYGAAGLPIDRSFQYIEGPVAEGSQFSWAAVITRARDEAFYVCRDLHELAERTSAADILGGVNASELAKDPSQIGGMLERLTGVSGLDINALKGIPGFSSLFDSISSFLPGAARTA